MATLTAIRTQLEDILAPACGGYKLRDLSLDVYLIKQSDLWIIARVHFSAPRVRRVAGGETNTMQTCRNRINDLSFDTFETKRGRPKVYKYLDSVPKELQRAFGNEIEIEIHCRVTKPRLMIAPTRRAEICGVGGSKSLQPSRM